MYMYTDVMCEEGRDGCEPEGRAVGCVGVICLFDPIMIRFA